MTPLATVDQRAVVLRRATEADTTAIAAIWNDAVSHGDATTELEPRTPAAQREWLACHGETHPVIVAESRDEVVAWGALSPYRPRPAFAASVEDSVYVKAGHRGRGLGALILGELVALARRADHHTIVARIRSTNAASLALHARFGFEVAGVEREIARIAGRWVDVVVMQVVL